MTILSQKSELPQEDSIACAVTHIPRGGPAAPSDAQPAPSTPGGDSGDIQGFIHRSAAVGCPGTLGVWKNARSQQSLRRLDFPRLAGTCSSSLLDAWIILFRPGCLSRALLSTSPSASGPGVGGL